MNTKSEMVDHLFRHHYGKMVATLTKLFGLYNLELIEDVVQDTFIKALSNWKQSPPQNPEGWLTTAAKNRAIDLLRQKDSDTKRILKIAPDISEETIDQVFLEFQIEDSQLRMIFTACHPILDPRDQIAFALKTISGFSDKEIAASLLLKLDTVKKRLTRARHTIKELNISFSIPDSKESKKRLAFVHRVLYLIFNEGYHSTQSESIVRSDLCGEALRLISLLLKKQHLRTGEGYALLGLFSFHTARLESKINIENELIGLEHQDRTKWDIELITLGNAAMTKAVSYNEISEYHLEAAIAAEHINSPSFDATNWEKILNYYKQLYGADLDDYSRMNLGFINIQLKKEKEAKEYLGAVQINKLGKRTYLYYGILAEYYLMTSQMDKANSSLVSAISHATNKHEKRFLTQKLDSVK